MDLEDGVQFPMLTQVTLAQLVERLTFNQVVMGSSPMRPTTWILSDCLRRFLVLSCAARKALMGFCPGGGRVDTGDLKSSSHMGVRVRVPLGAPTREWRNW